MSPWRITALLMLLATTTACGNTTPADAIGGRAALKDDWFCQTSATGGWDCVQDASQAADPRPRQPVAAARIPPAVATDPAPDTATTPATPTANATPDAATAPAVPTVSATPDAATTPAVPTVSATPDTATTPATPTPGATPATPPVTPTTAGTMPDSATIPTAGVTPDMVAAPPPKPWQFSQLTPAPAPAGASIPLYRQLAHQPEVPVAVAELPADFYTIQLLARRSTADLEKFARQTRLAGMAGARVEYADEPLYLLLAGFYANRETAERAAASLGEYTGEQRPWVRPLGPLQQAMADADKSFGKTAKPR